MKNTLLLQHKILFYLPFILIMWIFDRYGYTITMRDGIVYMITITFSEIYDAVFCNTSIALDLIVLTASPN